MRLLALGGGPRASGRPADTSGKIVNPVLPEDIGVANEPVNYLSRIISTAITLLLIVGSLFFFFNLVMGAIQWISSGGDKDAVSKARGRITSAIVGLVVLFAVFAITTLIGKIFNIQDILTLDIGWLFQ